MKEKYKEEDVKDLVKFIIKNVTINQEEELCTPLPGGENGKVTDTLFKLFISTVYELQKNGELNKK